MEMLNQYYFWLIGTSLFCFTLERIRPWRKEQKAFRAGFGQDLFWLVFNGHFLGLLLAMVTGHFVEGLNRAVGEVGLPAPDSLRLMAGQSKWVQFLVFFIGKDFVEWNIHRLLHRTWLWNFHKLHHSIKELDWIGNFRFHWGEIVVYKALSYLPLIVLGVDWQVLLIIAVISTVMQDLNHANLAISWGPLRYIFNSPKMHVWHHDVINHGDGGQNFGIVLSVWDWIFGTAYWPKDAERPEEWGFAGLEDDYPKSVWARFFYPIIRAKRSRTTVDR